MKRTLLVLPLLLLLQAAASGQDLSPATARNALYLEAGGTGLILSLNYERLLYRREGFRAGLRVGAMTDPTSFFNRDWYNRAGLPLEAVGLFGRRNHHLEVGMGWMPQVLFNVLKSQEWDWDGNELVVERGNVYYTTLFGRIGYRYQRPAGGLLFRAGITPMLYDSSRPNSRLMFAFFGGLSVGKSF